MDTFDYFVKSDLTDFVGQWVAILNDKIVASGKNFREVAEKVDKEFPKQKVLLARVPEKIAQSQAF